MLPCIQWAYIQLFQSFFILQIFEVWYHFCCSRMYSIRNNYDAGSKIWCLGRENTHQTKNQSPCHMFKKKDWNKNGVVYYVKQIVLFNKGEVRFFIWYLFEIHIFKYICHESLKQLVLRRGKFSGTCILSLHLCFILSLGLPLKILL